MQLGNFAWEKSTQNRQKLTGRYKKCVSPVTHILHQSVARDARHALVRVSAAQRAAETRSIRKVQDLRLNDNTKQ
jgi:hypothetical protein